MLNGTLPLLIFFFWLAPAGLAVGEDGSAGDEPGVAQRGPE